MVEVATVARLLAGVVLLLGNGYFVTIEFAMTRVRQFEEAAFQGSAGLERAWEMTERLEIYLSGCQLGITICSVGLGVVAEPALSAVLGAALGAVGVVATGGGAGHTALSALLALAVINLLHLTVGEQAPTYLGIERTRTIARYGAPILYWWTTLLSPIIRLADWLAKALLSLLGVEITRSWAEEEGEETSAGNDTRGQLISEMGAVLASMDLPADRRDEVMGAIAIDRLQVADIMVGREDVVAVSTEEPLEAALDRMREQPLTRFPLVGADLDERVGVIYVPTLLRHLDALEAGDIDLRDVAAPVMTVEPSLPVADLIDAFQVESQELALVVADGRTLGIVTTTDAFEGIAGDLEDPTDGEPT
mgnify:CR=1 FL=1